MLFWRGRVSFLCVFFLCNVAIQSTALGTDPVLKVRRGAAASLEIDPNRTMRARIPATVYSVNMQYNVVDIKHWLKDQRRIKPNVMSDLQTLPGGMFRYPGGLPSNVFEWEKSVVDYDKRVERRLIEGDLSTNTFFGVGEYLQFIKDTRTWTPWFTLNLLGRGTLESPIELPSEQLAESNQRLARYIKERTPNQSVRYYQLGNELDRNKFQWTYSKYVNRSLDTIRKIQAVDSQARFVPFMREYHWAYNPPKSGQGRADEYFKAVMQGLPMVRDFSLHYYFDGKLSPSHPFLTVPEVVDKIHLAVDYAKAARAGHYNVWITEYAKRFYLFGNTPPESGTSFDAALASGDLLIALAQIPVVKGAFMQGLDGGDRMLYFDSNTPTSSFWALRILSSQPYRRVLASKTTSPNNSGYQGGYDVRAVAFTNDAGDELGVSAVNRAWQGKTMRVKYPPFAGRTMTEKRRFVKGPDGKNPKYVEKNFSVQQNPIVNTKRFNAKGEVYVWLPPLSVSTITFD